MVGNSWVYASRTHFSINWYNIKLIHVTAGWVEWYHKTKAKATKLYIALRGYARIWKLKISCCGIQCESFDCADYFDRETALRMILKKMVLSIDGFRIIPRKGHGIANIKAIPLLKTYEQNKGWQTRFTARAPPCGICSSTGLKPRIPLCFCI